jgi:Hemerythrin HHE cation binding domain
MYRTERLRNDHDELNDLLDSLERVLSDELLTSNPDAARGRFVTLMPKLLGHFAVERGVLCPHMRQASDAKVINLTNRFDARLAESVEAFKGFNQRWLLPRWIGESSATYVAEATALCEDLRGVLQRELDELYPMAEAA